MSRGFSYLCAFGGGGCRGAQPRPLLTPSSNVPTSLPHAGLPAATNPNSWRQTTLHGFPTEVTHPLFSSFPTPLQPLSGRILVTHLCICRHQTIVCFVVVPPPLAVIDWFCGDSKHDWFEKGERHPPFRTDGIATPDHHKNPECHPPKALKCLP